MRQARAITLAILAMAAGFAVIALARAQNDAMVPIPVPAQPSAI